MGVPVFLADIKGDLSGMCEPGVLTQDMQNRMQETFGLRTQLKGSRKRGKIILQYYSEDELERLYQCLERLEG